MVSDVNSNLNFTNFCKTYTGGTIRAKSLSAKLSFIAEIFGPMIKTFSKSMHVMRFFHKLSVL